MGRGLTDPPQKLHPASAFLASALQASLSRPPNTPKIYLCYGLGQWQPSVARNKLMTRVIGSGLDSRERREYSPPTRMCFAVLFSCLFGIAFSSTGGSMLSRVHCQVRRALRLWSFLRYNSSLSTATRVKRQTITTLLSSAILHLIFKRRLL